MSTPSTLNRGPTDPTTVHEAEKLFASGHRPSKVFELLHRNGHRTSIRSCERWGRTFRKDGYCVKPKKLYSQIGRPQLFDEVQTHEMIELLICRPESSLGELKRFLKERFGVDTSIATLSRHLKRRGINKEKLCEIRTERGKFFQGQWPAAAGGEVTSASD